MKHALQKILCGSLIIFPAFLASSNVLAAEQPKTVKYNALTQTELAQAWNAIYPQMGPDDFALWEKVNPNVPKNVQELLAQFLKFQKARFEKYQNPLYVKLISPNWKRFVGCFTKNFLSAKQINHFDANYDTNLDQAYITLLYGKPDAGASLSGVPVDVNFDEIKELRKEIEALSKKFPNLKDYEDGKLNIYHPLRVSMKLFEDRFTKCLTRCRDTEYQAIQASAYDSDPLNQAMGKKYQPQYDETSQMGYTLLGAMINPNEDITEKVYNYTIGK